MSWIDDSTIIWRRSNGRCTVSVLRDPKRYHIHIIEQCGGDYSAWRSLNPRPDVRSVQEAVTIAETVIPLKDVHPVTLRVEPRRNARGDIVMAQDHYIGTRHVDERLGGARPRRRRR